MALTIKNTKDKLSICIDGDFTIYIVEEYREAMAKKFLADRLLEVDLSEVDEIDASGLQLLVGMSNELSKNGNEMKITAASDVARDALDAICLPTDIQNELEEVQI